MPSKRKSLMFASAFFTSVISLVIVCLVLATKNWVSSEIKFGDVNSTETIFITYGLFEGSCSKNVQNGLSVEDTPFQVVDLLENTKTKGFNTVIIILLVLSLISSFLSSGFTCYNAVSNPYQTFLGPIGVYTWNSISGICSLLGLFLFPANVEVNELSVELAAPCGPSKDATLSNTYGYSYWIVLLIVLSNAAAIIIIVFYQRARYSKRKERERPMEIAPKDGILF
ncbi:clarin-3 [Podarcis raffonei]|uniref:clarin-3 n=1 Tax=Podarcis raffonei TaxID=65483 RepID=UPI0023293EB2|nr:clarin-3 [Podarcis raffonei]